MVTSIKNKTLPPSQNNKKQKSECLYKGEFWMDSNVKEIRSFVIRKLLKVRRQDRAVRDLDPYRKGYADALAMVQSFIDRVIVNRKVDEHV